MVYLQHKYIKLNSGIKVFVLNEHKNTIDYILNKFMFSSDKQDIIGYYEHNKLISCIIHGSIFDNLIE